MPRMVSPVIAAGSFGSMLQPTIDVDDELVLRPFEAADAPAVLEAFNDPAIVHWHFRQFDELAEADDWIAGVQAGWRAETGANWAVAERSGGQVLGRVCAYTDLESGNAEVSYWMLPGARRRRVASRSLTALTAWLHAGGFHRLRLEHSTLNLASCGVAERCGYAAEGVMRGAHVLADGRHDVHLHAHLATDPEG